MEKNYKFKTLIITALFVFSFHAGCGSDSGMSITDKIKNVILSLTCIAENSSTSFDYTYAENIGDGRGITFGIIGFTSGTYDGTILLKHLQNIDPDNPLCDYISAFEAIDSMPHDADGLCDDLTGLDNFIADFGVHGDDPKVKTAQLYELEKLYWKPAEEKFNEVGASLNITMGEFYDCCVQHGEDGLRDFVNEAAAAMGGSPATGVNEIEYLQKFLDLRYACLTAPGASQAWRESADRVRMYERILKTGNLSLAPPFKVYCYDTDNSFTVDGSHP